MVTELPFVSLSLHDIVQTEHHSSEQTEIEVTEEIKEYVGSQISLLHNMGEQNDFSSSSISITPHPFLTFPSPPPDLYEYN